MKLIIIALLLGVAIDSSWAEDDEQASFTKACLDESNAKRAHDEFIGQEEDHSQLFLDYMKLREVRKELGQKLGVADCSEVAKKDPQVEAIDDEQLLLEICHEQKALEVFLKNENKDDLIHTRLVKRLKRDEWRRDRVLLEHKCPPIEHVDTSKVHQLAAKFKEFLQLSCRQRAEYGYILNKARQINKGLLGLNFGEDNVGRRFEVATYNIDGFCSNTYKSCCGEQLLEDARLAAIVPTAQLLTTEVDLMVGDMIKTYEAEGYKWDDHFNHLCALEHKTDKDKHFYPIRQKILKTLHDKVLAARKTLGKAISERKCPKNILEQLKDEGERVLEITGGPGCEEDNIKIPVMCETFVKAMIERKPDYGDGQVDLGEQLRNLWCAKSRQLKESPNYKGPTCSYQQLVDVLTKEAAAEAQILFELAGLVADLEKSTKATTVLRSKIKKAKEEQLAAIRRVKNIYKYELKEEDDPKMKKELSAAFKIVSDKKAQLKKLPKMH